MFGIDPDEARKDLADYRKRKLDIFGKGELLGKGDVEKQNEEIWKEWIMNYQKTLSKSPEFKELGDQHDKIRHESMDNRANPSFVLRNYLMEEAISAVEDKNDDSKVHQLLESALNPFKQRAKKTHPP